MMKKFLPVAVLTVMMMVIGAGTASARMGIDTFNLGPVGPGATQAGAHADITTFIKATTGDPTGSWLGGPLQSGSLRTLVADLPPGFTGNATAAPTCSASDFANLSCPVDSQVGTAQMIVSADGLGPGDLSYGVFLLEPSQGHTAEFGFNLNGYANVIAVASVRPDDYGLHIEVKDIPTEILPVIYGSKLTLWGVPADSRHDAERSTRGWGYAIDGSPLPFNGARRSFLANPTRCTGLAETAKVAIDSWQSPNDFVTASFDAAPMVGCDRLVFAPTVSVTPESRRAGVPSAYHVRLAVPQSENPDAVATANLRDVTLKLPAGVAVSPSSADALKGCSDAQLGFGREGAADCPAASKIGTVSIKTPLLEDSLEGSVYLGQPKSNDAQTGEMLRMFMVAEGTGVRVKLRGNITPDPVTGQLTAKFIDNPQMPFDTLDVRLHGGPRAPLTNPAVCGTYTTESTLTSWAGSSASPSDAFEVTQGADGGPCRGLAFAPRFTAGSEQPVAGASSPFSLTLSREDSDQDLSGLTVQLPPGLLGRIAGVAQCADVDAARGTCGAGSRVGGVSVGSGAGTNPFFLPGDAYLTGPYKGAPFGLAIVVRALAGPYDLGTVVVRAALAIDPLDAHVTVVSDPFPTILQGIPLHIRKLTVSMDRGGFMVNPTSCAPTAVGASVLSTAGATVSLASRFRVGGCGDLALKPSLALSLSGKGQTVDGKHPAVSAALTQPGGQANLKKVRVALPLTLALDPDNAESDGLCSFVEGSKPDPQCPASSLVGQAIAVTPILNQPLSGPVYFTKNERKDPKSGRSIKTLPKLVIPLVGENGVKLTLTGTSAVVDNQLVTTFDNIPDAPVSSFKLSINGGKKGILVISGDKADICRSTQVAEQQVDGQNNKDADADVYIQTPSCPLKVLSKKVGKRSVAIKVGGLGAGKVTVTGKGIKKTTKTISKSTVVTITAKRTKGKPGKVTVSFDPAGPAKVRKTTK